MTLITCLVFEPACACVCACVWGCTVSDFARKTGDFQVLSAIDIKVMALAYQLLMENDAAAGSAMVRDTPVTATEGAATVMKPTNISGHTAGFYMPKQQKVKVF